MALTRNKIAKINNTTALKVAITNKITIENRYDVSISAWKTPFMPTTTCIAVNATVTNAKSVMPAAVYSRK
jgi:hypothetical protein